MKQTEIDNRKPQQTSSVITGHDNRQQGGGEKKSSQQQQSTPDFDPFKAAWKLQVGSAKVVWGKITEDELLKSEGNAEKLTGLVQDRYLVSKEIANKQVKEFMDKRKY